MSCIDERRRQYEASTVWKNCRTFINTKITRRPIYEVQTLFDIIRCRTLSCTFYFADGFRTAASSQAQSEGKCSANRRRDGHHRYIQPSGGEGTADLW